MGHTAYEFLVRWDHETGALKGAHIKTYDTATSRESPPQPVAVAGSTGFPLADILTSLETGAILAMEAAQEALAVEKAAHEATKAAQSAQSASPVEPPA